MIDDKGDGDGGSGEEARTGLVAILFDGLSGGLVDILLQFHCGGETYDRITTLHLPLYAMGLK